MWDFPSNTVFARTLTLEMQRGQPSSARRIETQLLHFDGQGMERLHYRWNNKNSDADLVRAKARTMCSPWPTREAPGGKREIRWRF
jgi:hypothetical protein